MTCPYLKEVVMLYCDAYPVKKMVPLDRLVSTEPCLSQGWPRCPLFQGCSPAASTESTEPIAPAHVEVSR